MFVETAANMKDLNPRQSQKVEQLTETLESLSQSIHWVQIRLTHYVVQRRSICFVLDSYFEHYKH